MVRYPPKGGLSIRGSRIGVGGVVPGDEISAQQSWTDEDNVVHFAPAGMVFMVLADSLLLDTTAKQTDCGLWLITSSFIYVLLLLNKVNLCFTVLLFSSEKYTVVVINVFYCVLDQYPVEPYSGPDSESGVIFTTLGK